MSHVTSCLICELDRERGYQRASLPAAHLAVVSSVVSSRVSSRFLLPVRTHFGVGSVVDSFVPDRDLHAMGHVSSLMYHHSLLVDESCL